LISISSLISVRKLPRVPRSKPIKGAVERRKKCKHTRTNKMNALKKLKRNYKLVKTRMILLSLTRMI